MFAMFLGESPFDHQVIEGSQTFILRPLIGSPQTNLRRLHRSKNNHRKFIVIGQIIGFGKIDSFRSIESIL